MRSETKCWCRAHRRGSTSLFHSAELMSVRSRPWSASALEPTRPQWVRQEAAGLLRSQYPTDQMCNNTCQLPGGHPGEKRVDSFSSDVDGQVSQASSSQLLQCHQKLGRRGAGAGPWHQVGIGCEWMRHRMGKDCG